MGAGVIDLMVTEMDRAFRDVMIEDLVLQLPELMVVQELTVTLRTAIYLQAAEFGVLEFGSFYGTQQRKYPQGWGWRISNL